MFKIGQQVIFIDSSDVAKPELKGGTVTRVGKDTVWLDNQHKAEDQMYAAFLWPDNEVCRGHLQATLDMKRRHKEEDDLMFKRTLILNNEMIKEGLK